MFKTKYSIIKGMGLFVESKPARVYTYTHTHHISAGGSVVNRRMLTRETGLLLGKQKHTFSLPQ